MLGFGVSLSCLGACTLERPNGAFDPVYEDAAAAEPPDFDEFEAGPGVDRGPMEPVFGSEDASVGSSSDGGGGGPTGDPALADLVGDYWVRIDEFTTATSNVNKPPLPTMTISLRTRTSYLGMAQIKEENGALVSREVLCQQSVLHDCKSGCVNGDTKTIVYHGAVKKLQQAKAIKRDLSLNRTTNTLVGNSLTFPLGYDGSQDLSMPTRSDDPRVWDADAQLSGNEGFFTQVLLTLRYAGITRRADCRVSRVLKLETKWDAPLTKQGDRFQFAVGSPGEANLEGSDSVMFAARGYGDATDADCEGDSASGGDSPIYSRPPEIRFLKVQPSDVTRCPDIAVYDQRMPADAP